MLMEKGEILSLIMGTLLGFLAGNIFMIILIDIALQMSWR